MMNAEIDPKSVSMYFVENMHLGFVHMRLLPSSAIVDYEFIYANPAFCNILNVNDVQGKNLDSVFPFLLEQTPSLAETLYIAAFDRLQSSTRIFISRFNKWFNVSAMSPAQNEVIAYFFDYSEDVNAENILREREEKYRGLFDNMLEGFGLYGILTTNESVPYDAILLEGNTAYEKLTGFKLSEVINKTITELYPLTGPNEIAKFAKVAYGAEPFEYDLFSEDLDKYFRVRVISPKYGYFALLFDDISNRKRQEAVLLQQEKEYRTLAENSGDMIMRFDEEFKHIFANKASEITLNIPVNNFIGKTHAELGFSPEEYEPWHEAMAEVFKIESATKRVVYNKGVDKYFDWSLIPETDKNGKVATVLSITRDVTDIISGKLALEESEKKLKEVNSQKDKFFSILAHDLKSPFGTFMMALEMLSKEFKKMSAEDSELYLKAIAASSKELYGLLDNLLQWASLQRGILVFKPDPQSTASLVNETVSSISQMALYKEIVISAGVEDALYVLADKNMFNGILRNLLTNAIKFTPRGGTIEVHAEKINNKSILVSVTDCGIGIPEQYIDGLFRIDQKFSRLGTEDEPSSGLGLVLCKEFVEKQGGTIWVESKEDVGSTFKFTLPSVE